MSSLWPDVRFALRMLWKHKALTASALATISLALAANTAIFTLVSSVLLRPLPLPDPDRLVRIAERHGGRVSNLTGATFADVRERTTSFVAVASFRLSSPGLAAGDMPEQVLAADVSPDYLAALGVTPALGRGFGAADFAPGARRTVLLDHALWRRRFGGDRAVVGSTVMVNAVRTEVIGVMPAVLLAPGSPDIWLPQTPAAALRQNRRAHLFTVIARLRPGVGVEAARQEVAAVASGIRHDAGEVDAGLAVEVVPMRAWLVQSVRPALLALWGAVGLLLLIGSINVANLLLMHGTARAREISIRTALGASRRRIVRQFAIEAALLAAGGGAVGTLLGLWAVPIMRAWLPPSLPRLEEIAVGPEVFLVATLLSAVAALIFGGLPALRTSAASPAETLRDRHGDGRSQTWMRAAFVGAQVALTVVLLAGAGLLARSFLLLARVDSGFDPTQTLAFDLTLPRAKYPDAAANARFLSEVVGGLRAVPGIHSAGAAGALPLGGTASTTMVPQGADPAGQFSADVIPLTPGVLETLRIPLRSGRLFDERDSEGSMPVMLVNETAARTWWPDGADPRGRRITMLNWGDPYTAEVVGIVGDVRQAGPDTSVAPAAYYPLRQFPETLLRYSIILRASGDPLALAPAATGQVWRVDPDQPVAAMRTMDDVLAAALAQRRFNLVLTAAFAIAALALAGLGLYGILAFAVGQRTREIGVRVALGARAADVARVVVAHAFRPVLAGLALGLIGAVLSARLIRGLLYGVSGADPVTLGAVAGLVALAAAAAALPPIRRASTIDPAAVLRE